MRVLELVTREARRRGGVVDVRDVCAAAVSVLPVDGAGISVAPEPSLRHVLHTTDGISSELEDLQLTLGEGPCVDAMASGCPVLTADLSDGGPYRRWPAFAPAAHATGAAALFALPLGVGGRAAAVLDMYAVRTGSLEGEVLADALAFAETATTLLLIASSHAVSSPEPGVIEDVMGFDQYRAEIDQAVGMLTEQIGVGIDEASVRLRAYAYAEAQRVVDVAVEVVARRLRFVPDGSARIVEGE